MSAPISESQALRACNLPDTPHWRNWLRSNLAPQEISTGRIYDRSLVDLLAGKIGDFARATNPPEERQATPEPPRVGFSGPIDTGIRPRPKRHAMPLENRIGPQLETR